MLANLRLKDPESMPTDEALQDALGQAFAAYEAFQDGLARIEIDQEWQWYTPHKAWFGRGWHSYLTPRGTRKEKTLYWLYVYEGCFSVAVWFKEKNRAEILKAPVSDTTKQLIADAKTWGKVPTFPVAFEISAASAPLADIYTLINCKKVLEN
ncbi:MAG: DUF3788 domain-containing protein [Firmicutes bacterium]|nr:DUF3788 domain-containing protein [Bacillota bacterium]